MRAAYYEKNGSARDVLSLGELDTPKPGPGEVLVRLKTSGVNPSDVKSREGRTRKIVFPRVIPHSDGAGDIEAVGDGVPQSRVGERVWTWNGQWKRAFGTCADYIVLPAALAVKLPDHVSYEAGACLGIPAMTAYHAVEVAGPAKTVLVSGGAGGVGHYAIQFAKARGADRHHHRQLGCQGQDRARRRRRPHHRLQARERRRAGDGDHRQGRRRRGDRDGLLRQRQADAVRPAPAQHRGGLWQLQRRGDHPVAVLPDQNVITIRYIFVYELTPAERDAAVSAINRMLENKTLLNNVALTLPLKDIVAAHEAVEQGKALGNVVVSMS